MARFKWLLFLCFFSLPLAHSQSVPTLRVGAVLSLTGQNAAIGNAQSAALRAWQRGVQTRGLSVEILTVDDRSNPEEAARQAEGLVEDGVHALLCCATNDALERSLPVIGEGVLTLLLGPSPLPSDPAQNYWLFGVLPDSAAQLSRIALQEERSLALMGLEGEVGDMALGVLAQAGIRPVAEERYEQGVQTLTPEALWIATRQPGAVLVWGQMADTKLAVDALSQRGFDGRVYINPQVYSEAGVLGRADLRGTLTVTDALSVGRLPNTQPTYGETRRFISALNATSGLTRPSAAGAHAWDALTLLRRAFEQTLAYQALEADNTPATRQALRDALIGLGPTVGAAAIYDYSERDHSGVQPSSLLVARVARGQLVVP